MARTLKTRPAAGATLAEFLLSLGLVAILVLVVVELAMTAMRGNEKSGLLITADSVAQEQLDTFIYGLPGAGDPFWTAISFASPYQVDNVTLGTNPFQRELNVVDLGTVSPGLRQIIVNVTWWGGQNGRSGYGQQSTVASRLVSSP